MSSGDKWWKQHEFKFSAEQAEAHFTQGVYQVFTYGEPAPGFEKVQRALRKRYGVELYWTGGCCVAVEGLDEVEAYNERMCELLEKKFGKDIFEEAEKDLSRVIFKVGFDNEQ